MEEQKRGFRVKTINRIISKKFNDFTASIKDDHTRELVQANSIVTGGCITSMLAGSKVNDFDLYFTNKETVLAVARYYVNEFNAGRRSDYQPAEVVDGADIQNPNALGGVGLNMTPDRVKIVIRSSGVRGTLTSEDDEEDDYVEPMGDLKEKKEDEKKYRPVYLTCNAITLTDQIQLVIRFYGDPSQIHKNYDFVHCTNYWTPKHGLDLSHRALLSIMSKELVYIGSLYPIASMIRLRKFIKRGWVINAGQLLKIAYQISKLNLDKIEVLEDQLVGVDVAYFNALIHAMQQDITKAKEEGLEARAIDYDYLAGIIDKLF